MTKNFPRAAYWLRRLLLLSLMLPASLSFSAQAAGTPSITLIIDDIGYNLRNGMRAVNLPGAITYAVLPHTPYSQRLAKAAHQQGKVVMLHAPMTNVHQRAPGPGTLSPEMDKATFNAELAKALADIPFVQGVNNHMGSQLTQDKTRMQWLMQAVSQRRLFFIDSRTTAASIAATTAQESGVPSMSRDVFLDHVRTPEAVNASFDLLLRMAQRNGHAVGIGHPHTVTLAMLEARLPELEQKGIRLISVPAQLLAMGQSYPKETLLAKHPLPAPDEPPARSPAFWQDNLQHLTHNQAIVGGYPVIMRKEVVSRKPLPASEVDAVQRKKLLPEIAPGRPAPTLKPSNGQPARAGDITTAPTKGDLSQQKAREPEWLKPVPTQHWENPAYRTVPGITSTPN